MPTFTFSRDWCPHFSVIKGWEKIMIYFNVGLPRWLNGKESTCQSRRCRSDPWVRKIPWRRKWPPTLVFLPEKSHGQRNLAGYSPWGHKVLNMTELLNNNNILHIRGLKFSKTFISFWKSEDWYLAELALDQEDLTPESSRFLAGEKRQSNCHVMVWEALKERFRACVSPREGGPYSAWEGFPEVVPFALGGGCCLVTCLVQLFAAPWNTACQLFLSFTISQSLLKLISSDWWCHLTICPVVPFSSCLQSFPAWGSFLVS